MSESFEPAVKVTRTGRSCTVSVGCDEVEEDFATLELCTSKSQVDKLLCQTCTLNIFMSEDTADGELQEQVGSIVLTPESLEQFMKAAADILNRFQNPEMYNLLED